MVFRKQHGRTFTLEDQILRVKRFLTGQNLKEHFTCTDPPEQHSCAKEQFQILGSVSIKRA